MPRLVAVEWDPRELRLLVGRVSGGGVFVEHAASIDLPEPAEESAGPQLAALAADRGLTRGEVLLAIPRGKAELRVLSVPQVPDEELPDLVRFQALRQFPSLGEDWPLDFLPIGPGPEAQLRVLAAAIPPTLLATVRTNCAAAELAPQRLVVRPCASAALLQRQLPDSRARLLVELLADDIDLTVLVEGQVVFVRSVRRPTQDVNAALVAEVRRTVVAAQNQLGDRQVDQVVVCGDEGEASALTQQLRTQLTLEVAAFDPWADVGVGRDFALPRHPARYAPLLGLLHEEASGVRAGLDFLNPRRKPAPPDRRRRYVGLGVAVAALLLLLGGCFYLALRSSDQRIRELQADAQEWDQKVKESEQLRTRVAEIDGFVVRDINWLDELYDLSVKLPPAEQAIIEQATCMSRPGGGGQIVLEGHVRDPSVIEALETALRDERHQVVGSGGQFDERQDEYRWRFKETILIAAPDVEEVARHD